MPRSSAAWSIASSRSNETTTCIVRLSITPSIVAMDWIETLTPEERAEWNAMVDHVRKSTVKEMAKSAFVASLVPDGETDVKFAVELGLAIMLDKPILAVIAPGQCITEHLKRVADVVVEADLDTEAGMDAVREAVRNMQEANENG